MAGPDKVRWRRRLAGFTLIELLVVVAIIMLLIAILMPSLLRAKEQAKRALCMSHMRQQGVGFMNYSADHRNYLPIAGSFRWDLVEGTYYTSNLMWCSSARDWVMVNHGALFPRYVGKEGNVYYCPSNTTMTKDDPENGLAVLWQRYRHQHYRLNNSLSGPIDPEEANSHNFPISPMSAYGYAVPAGGARFPRDAGPKMYQGDISLTSFPGYPNPGQPPLVPPPTEYSMYINDPGESDQNFLGPWPKSRRGQLPWPALLADAYFGGWAQGYHLGGYNVLYCDMHARWTRDPGGRIFAANLPDPRGSYDGPMSGRAKTYMVWEFFSQHP